MLTTDRVSGSLLALVALGVIWESRNLPFGTLWQPGPAYMPVLLALLLLLFSVFIAATGGSSDRLATVGWKEWRHALAILFGCAFAAFAVERLGYRLTVLLLLVFLVKGVERKSWVLAVTFALALAFGSFYLFHNMLRVPLPYGPFGV
jgi:hypothetical protein